MPDKPISFVYDSVSAEQKRVFALARWKRDGVRTLPEGVSLVTHGKAASIYLRRGGRFMALDAELAGTSDVDVFVYTQPGLSSWVDTDSFESVPATPQEQREALEAVRDWLNARPSKFAFYPPLP
ncbi:MAG TPA: hypothetical protein VHM31_06325 [Polyangia bacterium]|nr:hypothetical protein [Polyangia bacterium]